MKRMTYVEIAKLCHKVNKDYCLALGDDSQMCWDDAPDWQKESAIKGVEFHIAKNRSPSESHESWMTEKVKDGWKFGMLKDPIIKEHPCMVPYDKLPVEQRAKDYIFKAICDFFRPNCDKFKDYING